MYIAVMILGIISFIFSFIPLLNVILSIIPAIIIIVIYIKTKKQSEKKNSNIISIILAIISIIITIIVDIYSCVLLFSTDTSSYDYNYSTYVNNFSEFIQYDIGDEISIAENLDIVLNSYNVEDNVIYLDMTVLSKSDNEYFTIFDFYIYDLENDLVYFPKYVSEDGYLMSQILNENISISGKIKIEIDNEEYDISNLYLMYDEDEVKIAIKL